MPEEQTLERQVRIFKPAKNAMQSGTAGIKRYTLSDIFSSLCRISSWSDVDLSGKFSAIKKYINPC